MQAADSRPAMSSTPPKIEGAEAAPESPVRLTRNRRSISLTTNVQESPKRNLRKRAVSPENKPTPVKTMTPTKRLRKNETNLLITFDSPKPRRGRLSLDAPLLDTSNLRRSRRLSTELNVVQEDPIKEAEVEASPASQPTKGRRGKRLSVLPTQPSVPEENEEPIVEAETIDVKIVYTDLQTISEASNELCKSQDSQSNVGLLRNNPTVCIKKLVLINDCESEQCAITDVNKSPAKDVDLLRDSYSSYELRRYSLNRSEDNVEDINTSGKSLNSSQNNSKNIDTSKKSLNRGKDNVEDLNTSKKSLNESQNIVEDLNTSKKSLNRSKDNVEELNISKKSLNKSQDNVEDLNTSKKSSNSSLNIVEVLNTSEKSLNKSKDNVEDLNISKKSTNTSKENIEDLNTSKDKIEDLNTSEKPLIDIEDNVENLNANTISLNNSKENIGGRRRSLRETPNKIKRLSIEDKSEKEDDFRSKNKREKTPSISIDESNNSNAGRRDSLPREGKKRNSIGDCSVLSVDDKSITKNLDISINSLSETPLDKTLVETTLKPGNDSMNVSEKQNNSSKSLLEKSVIENLNDISVISNKRNSLSGEENKKNIVNGSMNTSLGTISEKRDKSASILLLETSVDDNLNTSKKNTSLNSSRKKASEFFVEEKSRSLREEKDISIKISAESIHNTSSEKENANESREGKKRKSIADCSPKLAMNKSNSQTTAVTSTPLVKNKLNDSVGSVNKNKSKLSQIAENEIEDIKNKLSESIDSNFDSDSTEDNIKITFLDSSASDAGSDYESGDSMPESEKMEIAMNQAVEKGVSLNSENTSTDADSNDTYEKDSFVCSSDEEEVILLSGSGDDLSSGAELSQSKESKEKYDAKEKKKQKMASREMYEARHGIEKKRNNSGKNNFILSSSEDDGEEEKEISIKNTSGVADLSNDPLKMTFIENLDNSSDDEDVQNLKCNYEDVLKRLGESKAVISKDSNSDNETEFVDKKILNGSKNDSFVGEKSNKISKKQKKGLNKSDILKTNVKGTQSTLSKSFNLGSDATDKPISMQESMDRLLTLNKSLSKVFTSLVNDIDKLKDTVYDGAPDATNNKTDDESLILEKSQKNAELEAATAAIKSNASADTVTTSRILQVEKRKLDTSDAGNEQSKKIKIAVEQESKKVGKLRHSQESLHNNVTDSKYKLSEQSKLIKKNKQTKDVLGKMLKTKVGNSIFDFKVRPKSPALKNKATSTSQFVVEELKSAADVKCTETAGKFSVVRTKQEKRLCKLNLGSTTNFAIASLKNNPMRVDAAAGNEFVNFKRDMLYGKDIRRETSQEMLKKQQKKYANQKSRRIF